ncbi:MAG TPA: hypothetical protein VF950_28000 [Planctomycetota bacterium]
MRIICVSCRKEIPAGDVNIDTSLAKCLACHAVFDFTDQVKGGSAPAKKRDRGEIPMPKNLVVAEGMQSLDIVRKWARGPAFFFLFFSGFWNSIVMVFVVAAASGGFKDESGDGFVGWFIWVFLTPFILIGLGTGYAAIALLLNKTTIKVEGTELKVSHGPMRWPGAKTLDAARIDQLYCAEYVAYTQNNRPQYRMKIHALMLDGSKVDLISGIDEINQALYLEQILEKHLGIEDRPVRDEYAS